MYFSEMKEKQNLTCSVTERVTQVVVKHSIFLAQGKRSPDLLDIITMCQICTGKTSYIITKPEIIYVQTMGISTVIPSKNYRVNKEEVLFSTKQFGLLHESRNKSPSPLCVNLMNPSQGVTGQAGSGLRKDWTS